MKDQAGPVANHKSIFWISVLALFTAAFANAVRAGSSVAIKAELRAQPAGNQPAA
jgi:hypothetical protein